MTKRHFIALADIICQHNMRSLDFGTIEHGKQFDQKQISTLADFCAEQNPSFNRQRWLDYIAGKCGPNGGKIK